MTFAEALLTEHKKRSWSQDELVYYLRATLLSVRWWEAGKGPPNIHFQHKLLNFSRTIVGRFLEQARGSCLIMKKGYVVLWRKIEEGTLAKC